MAVSAGSAYLDIAPRLQRTFSRDLTRQMFGPAGQAAHKTGDEAGRRFGDRFSRGTKAGVRPVAGVFRGLGAEIDRAFGGRVAVALGGAAIAVGLKKTVDAASDLNETLSKTRVVFGPAAAEVERFGDTAARSLGMSRQQALEATATLGNLFVSMKLGRPAAAQMSTQMVRLATDLASFNNADPSEVLEALRSGLVGETEPLRRFGINLNDAALRAEAMRLGLGKIGPTLTSQQKAQASYSLILQQSKTAQGDFARTSDGLANQQRILAAEFKDAQAALGEQLLPAMLKGVRLANRLLDGFSGLNKATGGLAAQGLLAAGGLAAVGFAVGKTITFARDAREAWGALRGAKVAQVAVDAALGDAEVALAGKTAASGAAAQAATSKWVTLRTAMVGAGVPLLAFGVALETTSRLQEQATGRHERGIATFLRTTGVLSPLADLIPKYTRATKDSTAAVDAGKAAQDAYAQALATVGGKQADTSAKTAELTGKLKELKQGFKDQVQSVRDSIESYDGLIAKSDVTAAQVVRDLNNQVRNFQTYSTDVRRLIRAGVSPDAIKELSVKGPQYVHALATGTNRQLEQYKSYWRDRQREVRTSFADSMQRQYEGLVRKIRAMQAEINRLKGKTITVAAALKLSFSPTFTAKDWVQVRLAAGRMAAGGPVGGVGPRGKDNQLRWLAPDEHVWTGAEVVAAGGHASMERWRKAVLAGEVPELAGGGPVGRIDTQTGYVNKVQAWGTGRRMDAGLTELLRLAPTSIPHTAGSWKLAVDYLRRLGMAFQVISTFRPGARTRASGAVSYHALNRAVDIAGPNMLAIFEALTRTNPTELIYSGANRYKSRRGWRPIGALDPITLADHWSHVHAAYDKGGWLMPGQTGVNTTSRPEAVGFDYDHLAAALVRSFMAALQRQPVVAVVDPRGLQVGMNAYAGRMGQPRPYR